jgi:hypothetical protein
MDKDYQSAQESDEEDERVTKRMKMDIAERLEITYTIEFDKDGKGKLESDSTKPLAGRNVVINAIDFINKLCMRKAELYMLFPRIADNAVGLTDGLKHLWDHCRAIVDRQEIYLCATYASADAVFPDPGKMLSVYRSILEKGKSSRQLFICAIDSMKSLKTLNLFKNSLSYALVVHIRPFLPELKSVSELIAFIRLSDKLTARERGDGEREVDFITFAALDRFTGDYLTKDFDRWRYSPDYPKNFTGLSDFLLLLD